MASRTMRLCGFRDRSAAFFNAATVSLSSENVTLGIRQYYHTTVMASGPARLTRFPLHFGIQDAMHGEHRAIPALSFCLTAALDT